MVDSWKRLLKEGNPVSDVLRKDTKVLEWVSKQGDKVPQSGLDDLIKQVDGPIKEAFEDVQGRLSFVLERSGQSNKVVSVHPTSSGTMKTTTFSPAYNPDLNPNIPVPLSKNKLVPDYMGTQYMHPLQGDEVVKIKLSGNRNEDFSLARAKLGISKADETVNGVTYTWHHMDDFEIINGEAYGTMQLVKSTAHQGKSFVFNIIEISGTSANWKRVGVPCEHECNLKNPIM